MHLPLYSIALSGLISMLLSLINIGSSVAFNVIVSVVVASFFLSYMIPISLMAWRRLSSERVVLGPWNMGKLGLPVNLFALVFLGICWIFSFFPIATPPTLVTMNWSCLMWGFCTIFGCAWYALHQRHHFTGPKLIEGSLIVH
jgi:choline transport protein